MSIQIQKERCIGCGRCEEVCPGNLIRLDESRTAHMRIPEDCWGCASCMKACPAGAIFLFLGADIGGRGSVMQAKQAKEEMIWTVTKADGSVITIPVRRSDANAY